MKKELVTALHEKYPLIFSTGEYPSCGDGWYTLIDVLCNNIQSHISNVARQRTWALEKNVKLQDANVANNGHSNTAPYDVPELVEQVVALQIKEKFGTLRFYVNGGDRYINGAIQMADSMSEHICEECGNTGKRRSGRWIRTLCDQHNIAMSLGAPNEFLNP